MQCLFCGRLINNKNTYCNNKCESDKLEFDSKEFKTFASYNEAAMFFNMDERTLKKYENIKFNIIRVTKKRICIDCNILTEVSDLTRVNRCKICVSKNMHRAAQGLKISKLYKGENNPNYIDGKSIERGLVRGTGKYKKFIKEFKSSSCEITGFNNNLEVHHILPISIFPEYVYCNWNIITICSNMHYEIHKQKLDINFILNTKNTKDNIKENFINFVNSEIKITESIHIDRYDFIKILIKNYYSYLSKDYIDEIKNNI